MGGLCQTRHAQKLTSTLPNPTKGQPREISSRHQGLEKLRIDDASIPCVPFFLTLKTNQSMVFET
jgi:hypothetical protein